MPAPVEDATLDALVELKKPEVQVITPEVPKAAPTIKELEAEEPLLRENPQRFVLFPIKYHEVSNSRPPRVESKTDLDIDMGHVQEGRGIVLDC